MNAKHLIMIGLTLTTIIFWSAACSSRPSPTPVLPTVTLRRGEPARPLVSGEVTGVESNDLVTIHVRGGVSRADHTRPGPGPWEIVISSPIETEPYTVTAEATGYTSLPLSYTVRIEGETVYVLRGDQLGEEATDLDFHFTPVVP